MNSIRARVQVFTFFFAIFFGGIWTIIDLIKPHPYEFGETIITGLGILLVVGVLIDGILASYFINKIVRLSLKKIDDITLSALRDASVWQLSTVANAAERGLSKFHERVAELLAKASANPELLHNKHFLSAVHSFKFAQAERIIQYAERSARIQAEEAKRREVRKDLRMVKLLGEAEALGLAADETSHLSAGALRDLVERTRTIKDLQKRASVLGCTAFIEQHIQESNFDGAQTFLLRAEKLVEAGRRLEVEQAVREFVWCNNLEGADKLLRTKQDEALFGKLKQDMGARVAKIREAAVRHEMQKLLDAVCVQKYGTREFQMALHAFDTASKTRKV